MRRAGPAGPRAGPPAGGAGGAAAARAGSRSLGSARAPRRPSSPVLRGREVSRGFRRGPFPRRVVPIPGRSRRRRCPRRVREASGRASKGDGARGEALRGRRRWALHQAGTVLRRRPTPVLPLGLPRREGRPRARRMTQVGAVRARRRASGTTGWEGTTGCPSGSRFAGAGTWCTASWGGATLARCGGCGTGGPTGGRP